MTTQQKIVQLDARIAELEQQKRDVIRYSVPETQVEVSPELRQADGAVVPSDKNWL